MLDFVDVKTSIVHVYKIRGLFRCANILKQQMLSVELSSCYVFRQQYVVKRIKCSADCSAIFLFTTKTCQPRPQVFSVNSALNCNCAALLRSSVDLQQRFYKFGQQQLVMVNYACAFRNGLFGFLRGHIFPLFCPKGLFEQRVLWVCVESPKCSSRT